MSTLENLRFFCRAIAQKPVVCDRENPGKVAPFDSDKNAVDAARKLNENSDVRSEYVWMTVKEVTA